MIVIHDHALIRLSTSMIMYAVSIASFVEPKRITKEDICVHPTLIVIMSMADSLSPPVAYVPIFVHHHRLNNLKRGKKIQMPHCIFRGMMPSRDGIMLYPNPIIACSGIRAIQTNKRLPNRLSSDFILGGKRNQTAKEKIQS